MGFNAFDPEKKGAIKTDQISTIFSMMGKTINSDVLNDAIAEVDPFGIFLNLLYNQIHVCLWERERDFWNAYKSGLKLIIFLKQNDINSKFF